MTKFGGPITAAGALALVLAFAPAPLAAQDAPVFSIPSSRPTTNPRAQGPVDDDVPVVRTAPRPTPSAVPTFAPPPTPVPTAAPTPAASQPQPATGTSRQPRPAAQQTPRTQAPTAAQPGPASSGAAAAPSIDTGVAPVTAAGAAPAPVGDDAFALPPVADSQNAAQTGWYWPWIAGAAAALAALFGALWWRRRKAVEPVLSFEPPVVRRPEPEARPEPVQTPIPQPAVAAPPLAAPLPVAATSGPLAISLEARRMNASLMATTLSYAIRLTNTSDQTLEGLAIEADMIAAHASLPPEKQIANDNQRLEPRHALVSLAPGESAEFTGDFRLPLATLVPIRAGDAALFIPLARVRIEARDAQGKPLVQVQTYVVGELPEQPGAALRPFRLDLGPRTYSRVGQRALG